MGVWGRRKGRRNSKRASQESLDGVVKEGKELKEKTQKFSYTQGEQQLTLDGLVEDGKDLKEKTNENTTS